MDSVRRDVEAQGRIRFMLEIGLFHNGASSLPVIANRDGVTFNDGALPEVHLAAQETLVNQVRQGILAEKLGFQSFWLTEHHFQPEGAEMSPNPLMVQMNVAAHTKPNGTTNRRSPTSGVTGWGGSSKTLCTRPATRCRRRPRP